MTQTEARSQMIYFVGGKAGPASELGIALSRVVPQVDPSLGIESFVSCEEFKKNLEANPINPWAIFLDETVCRVEARGLLSWLKRNAKLHFAPVIVVVTPDQYRARVASYAGLGAFGCLEMPSATDELKALLERRKRLWTPPEELQLLDQIFSEELVARVASAREHLLQLSDHNVRKLYHVFHTIKGSANTLEYRPLSAFMHEVEEFLAEVQRLALYASRETFEMSQSVIRYLEGVVAAVSSGGQMAEPPPELVSALECFVNQARTGQKIGAPVVSTGGVGIEPGWHRLQAQVEQPFVAHNSDSLRISCEKIEELGSRFRKILAIRIQLGRFTNQLKSEFFDEVFPNNLQSMVDDLQQETHAIMEFIAGLRLVPIIRLKAYAERVMIETMQQTEKAARQEFVCPAGLSVDPKIFDCLEVAALHLVRNSIDHGIEKAEVRAMCGKDPIGKLTLTIREFGSDKIMALFEDDGAGINIAAIKRAVTERGALAGAVLEKMKPLEIAQLIFSDNLSTKRKATEISGRGIGLSLVKQQISDLGGTIELYFEEGVGSRFTIVLPRIFKA